MGGSDLWTTRQIRTGAVPGTAIRAVDSAGPVATKGEVDDEVVRAKVLRDVAVRVREVRERLALNTKSRNKPFIFSNERDALSPLSPSSERRAVDVKWCLDNNNNELTQLLVLIVELPFRTSEGTLPALRSQYQTLIEVSVRSIAYQPPPAELNGGP